MLISSLFFFPLLLKRWMIFKRTSWWREKTTIWNGKLLPRTTLRTQLVLYDSLANEENFLAVFNDHKSHTRKRSPTLDNSSNLTSGQKSQEPKVVIVVLQAKPTQEGFTTLSTSFASLHLEEDTDSS